MATFSGGMFGAPNGEIAAANEQATEARTQETQLNVAQKMRAMRQQQGTSTILQQLAQSNPNADPVDILHQASMEAFKAGYGESGEALAGKASALTEQGARSALAQGQAAEAHYKTAQAELSLAGQLLGNVTDQSSWDAANRMWEQMTGRPSPYAKQPYSPELASQLRTQALTLKDQMTVHMQQWREQQAAAAKQAQDQYRKRELELREQSNRIRAADLAARNKVGGKNADVGSPSKEETSAATDALMRAYPNLSDDQAADISYRVASIARGLRKSNPGLNASMAIQQAIMQLKPNLDQNQRTEGVLSRAVDTFKGTTHPDNTKLGTTPDQPYTSVPKAGERAPGYYKTPDGHVRQWTGRGWSTETFDPKQESSNGPAQ